jgi:hypothetical protein
LRGGFGAFGVVLVNEENRGGGKLPDLVLTLDTRHSTPFLRGFLSPRCAFFGEALFAGLILIWSFLDAVLAGAFLL